MTRGPDSSPRAPIPAAGLPIRRLEENNYAPAIRVALASQELPLQFLYLAMQESNFRPRIVGPPPTRYGHAKGMWQFIPFTGARYDLRIGPLKDTGWYDPADERHDIKKVSYAAARYLKDIYRTDAQASGLLVMASGARATSSSACARCQRIPVNAISGV